MPEAITSIGLIAPTVEVAARAERMAQELGMAKQVVCRVGNHMEGVAIAKELEQNGVEVFISRRSTAALIDNELSTPNVSIPITLQDIAQALHEARNLTGLPQPRVALFIMPSDQPDVEAFANHSDLDLRIYPVTADEDYLALMVDRAIGEKMDVIIAGTIVTIMANKRNFPCVLMDAGPVALRTALLEAKRVEYARKYEKSRAEIFKIVVNTMNFGIIVVDATRKVAIANPVAQEILQTRAIAPDTCLDAILPELDLSQCFDMGKTLRNV